MLFTLLIIFLLASFNINDFDSWIHLSFGRYIVENHSFISREVFVYPNLNSAITNPEWLFQVIIYLAYKAGGLAGVVLFKASIITLCFFFFWRLLETMGIKGPYYLAPITIITALLMRSRFVERPEIFVYLFFILFLLIFTKAYQKKTGLVYVLPFLQVIWSNMHPSTILGIVIAGTFFSGCVVERLVSPSKKNEAGEGILMYLIIFIFVASASLVNPYFYTYIPAPVQLVRDVETVTSINEMQSVTAYSEYLIGFISVFTAGLVALIVSRKNIPLAWFLLFFFFAYVSFSVIRSLPLFFIIAMPLIAKSICDITDKGTTMFRRFVFTGVMLLFGGIILYTGISGKFALGLGEEKQLFAKGAIDFIKEKGLDNKRLFNYFGWGGYISWRLSEGKVFIDGRYASGRLSSDYDHVMAAALEWNEILDRYGIEFIVTNSIGYSDGRIYPLIYALIADKRWQLVYADSSSLIFINGDKGISLPELPKSVVFHEIVKEGEYLYNFGIRGYLLKTLGSTYLKLEDYKKAKHYYQRWIEKNPSDESSKTVLEIIKTMGY